MMKYIILNCKKLSFSQQTEFFWYFKDANYHYRVFKFFPKTFDDCYSFELQKYIEDGEDVWEFVDNVTVEWEISEDNFTRDPEPIRPFSINGFRVRLHNAYLITRNIHEAFYLISKEIYEEAIDIASWFGDKEENKFHERVLANNTLKLFQAFDVFKEDIDRNDWIVSEIRSLKMDELINN
jgi:hypothetical protein